jgi:hypothetical protein
LSSIKRISGISFLTHHYKELNNLCRWNKVSKFSKSILAACAFAAVAILPIASAAMPMMQLKLPTREEDMGEEACAVLLAYSSAAVSPPDMEAKASTCSLAMPDTCKDTQYDLKRKAKPDANYQKAISALRCRTI